MASIQPTNVTTANAATSQQLSGIIAATPMPTAGVLADGSPFTLALNDQLSIGGQTGPDYTISAGGDAAALAAAGAGQITVGGGVTAPAAGAQPAAPPTAAAAATKVEGGGALAPGESNAVPVTGFGRNERDTKMLASVDGAEFSFPSFNESKKRNSAPDISWGPGWTKVQKGDMFYMEHANGTKAIPALEYRTNNSPAGKTQNVKVANGWGKKYPDGTILVFDRNEGPYRLDAKGKKHKLSLGTHTFGGVKVRVFEASVVRTLEPNGEVRVFDSRGNAKAGTTRKTIANGLGNADAGASTSGGGKSPVDGGGAPGKPGMLVGGGGLTKEQLTADVQKMTEIARGILEEIRSGNVDPARLEALQAQLATLPSGILQAAGAAGTMSTDGILAARHGDHDHDATTTTTETAPPPGATVGNATGGGDATTPPTAGVDANATSKHVKAGEQLKLDITIPSELVGKQARFAQLPESLQEALAAALGSNQGAAAMTADRLVAFGKDGTATIVESGDVYLRRAKKVYGAGPGEDIAATMKPGRQPGGSHTKVASSTAASSTSGGAAGVTVASNGADSVSYPGVANTAKRHQVFGPGGRVQHVDLGGVSGTFTWKTLPQAAKNAIRDFLATEPTEASSQAYAARPGTGWKFDENAVVTVESGFATFPDGMSLLRAAKPEAAPVDAAPVRGGGSGSGATSQPVGHDATRPPTGGGGTSPATPPPTPNIGAGSGGSVHDHH